jgi:hypothetical protein
VTRRCPVRGKAGTRLEGVRAGAYYRRQLAHEAAWQRAQVEGPLLTLPPERAELFVRGAKAEKAFRSLLPPHERQACFALLPSVSRNSLVLPQLPQTYS